MLTMILLAISPWISLFLSILLKFLKTWRDKGYPRKLKQEIPTTRCKNHSEYIELHAGAEFKIQAQYAKIMILVSVSFLYGIQIPLMFVICTIGIANIYITDRLSLAYIYKKPPITDTSLQISLLKFMQTFPFLCFINGYWVIGNRQIFYNVIN